MNAVSGAPREEASFRHALREATAAKHEALDQALSHALNGRDGYVRFLRGTLRVLSANESALDALEGLELKARIEALQQDLEELSAASSIDPSASVPKDPAQSWGAAYVIEGSGLGGLVLAKRAAELGIGATRYLTLRGSQTMASFRAFVARLERWAAVASHPERTAAVNGALQMFSEYRRAFVLEQLIPERHD